MSAIPSDTKESFVFGEQSSLDIFRWTEDFSRGKVLLKHVVLVTSASHGTKSKTDCLSLCVREALRVLSCSVSVLLVSAGCGGSFLKNPEHE